MLQIRLGQAREIEPSDDPMGRSMVGSWPGMTEQEAWEAGRGIWKFNADRALQEDEVQIINLDGIVLAVAEITGITTFKDTDRYALAGHLLVGEQRVGQPTVHPHPSRNSLAYF